MNIRRIAFALFAVAALSCDQALAASPDLSPLAMFLQADVVVKAVMVGLAAASVTTWTICIAKAFQIRRAARSVRGSAQLLASSPWVRAGVERLAPEHTLARALTDAALSEMQMSELASDKAGVKERVRSRLARLELAAGREIATGLGVLASIGSTAPFVGLFGTVWGIMNAFIGISAAQTTNLSVVAPGIAEALLATAIGLVAAIPAVLVYNHFTRKIAGYRALVGDLAEEIMRMTSRELDRREMERRDAGVRAGGRERIHGG